MVADAGHELLEVLVVEVHAWLVWVGTDLRDRDLARRCLGDRLLRDLRRRTGDLDDRFLFLRGSTE